MAERFYSVWYRVGSGMPYAANVFFSQHTSRKVAVGAAFDLAGIPGHRFVTVNDPGGAYAVVPHCHERVADGWCGSHDGLVNNRCADHGPKVGQLAFALDEGDHA